MHAEHVFLVAGDGTELVRRLVVGQETDEAVVVLLVLDRSELAAVCKQQRAGSAGGSSAENVRSTLQLS